MYTKIAITSLFAAGALGAPGKKLFGPPSAYADQYTFYEGNGSPEAGWPDEGSWSSYEELWAVNAPVMEQSCEWNGGYENNSEQEIADINTAIQQVSGETGVDARFILSIVMQESKGCVRIHTTDNGVINPGLMQSHNGEGSCFETSPCPADEILLMIRDGTAGTAHGDGLQQILAETSGEVGEGARATYAAARKYNSGSVDYDNLNERFTATACYATDVANRLTGWVLADTACPLE